MKKKKKDEAIKLRETEGLSLGDIASKLGVSKSSVSLWVRDIALTPEQKTHLSELNPILNRGLKGSIVHAQRCEQRRRQAQEDGRKKAGENNLLHAMGCMLYWGEGAKSSNDLRMVNSDLNMLVLFKRFLKDCYNVSDKDISLRVSCYRNSSISVEGIEQYWLTGLSLSRENLRKTTIDPISKYSKKKRKTLTYGTCSMVVHDVLVVQSIFGALQEYGQFTKESWLS